MCARRKVPSIEESVTACFRAKEPKKNAMKTSAKQRKQLFDQIFELKYLNKQVCTRRELCIPCPVDASCPNVFTR